MKKYERKELYALICSLLPGATEMYLGFMKNGLTLMGIFFLGFIVPVSLEASKIFFLIPALVWFYGFFHARRLVDMEEGARRRLPDLYIWEEFRSAELASLSEEEVRRLLGIFLLVCGAILLWNQLMVILCAMIPDTLLETLQPVFRTIPRLIISILILLLGAHLLHKEKELPAEEDDEEEEDEEKAGPEEENLALPEAVNEEVMPEEAVSEEAVSEEAVSEEAVSGEPVSEEAVSEESVSEESVSEEAAGPAAVEPEDIAAVMAEEEAEEEADLPAVEPEDIAAIMAEEEAGEEDAGEEEKPQAES